MVEKLFFGTHNGQQVDCYRITNSGGTEVSVISYGAIIQSLKVADKRGVFENVVLGYTTLAEYLNDKHYLGAVVGRFSNRIANGKFLLDGVTYNLTQNNNGNHLHGGLRGFSHVVWSVEIISNNAVKLFYSSPDGEEGYPGNLLATVTYTLSDDNELIIDFFATTNKATIVSMVQHSYFNLSGGTRNILDHSLTIKSDTYLEVNNTLIPTGEMKPVKNSPFDFTTAKAIGSDIEKSDVQLQYGNGYDHTWVLDHPKRGINKVAELVEKVKGRKMDIYTDKPGFHVYSGNSFNGNFQPHAGVCLETQHFPNAPNQAGFPSAVLLPGEHYKSTTIFKFVAQ